MTDQDSDAMLDASGATDGADWLSRIQAMGEDAGTFEPLGAGHLRCSSTMRQRFW